MKILYIATSFPEPSKGATIYTDLAEALFEAGHKITVAVSEQPKNLSRTTFKIERGLNVLRIVTGNYYDVSLLEKGLTTLFIPIKMRSGISKYLKDEKFDFILYESPPVTNANLVSWAKKKFACPSYLMLKDIFPQNAVDIGLLKKNGFLYKYFLRKEKLLYRSADVIGCMSAANREYILEHNPSIIEERIELFPNTKKLNIYQKNCEFPMRKKFSISEHTSVFLFGGNMGKPQYVDLLCDALIKCKNNKQIFFLLVGRGTERHKLEHIIKTENIQNAQVIENLPREEFEQITKECDVGLIILDPRFTIPNYPSRILSYMEYSKPVLAATDKITDLRELIQESKCGEWVWSGDKDAFAEAILKLAESSNLSELGNNGRKYIEKNFSVRRSVEILEKHFSE